uniref:Ribosomal RNA-processing protein 14/surfeit locus protein 6 C-terminal domain-containing protein n=1 Tax=Micrurus paraensis TaxID=1970185 RepID=A0A2D4JWZ2_9SAUR
MLHERGESCCLALQSLEMAILEYEEQQGVPGGEELIKEDTSFNQQREQQILKQKRKRMGIKTWRFEEAIKKRNVLKAKQRKWKQQKRGLQREILKREGDKNWSQKWRGKIKEKRNKGKD